MPWANENGIGTQGRGSQTTENESEAGGTMASETGQLRDGERDCGCGCGYGYGCVHDGRGCGYGDHGGTSETESESGNGTAIQSESANESGTWMRIET